MNATTSNSTGSSATHSLVNWAKLLGTGFAGSRACVTGGAGFIGSHVVDALVSAGASVVVVDDLSTGNRGNLPHCTDRVRLVKESILEPQKWERAIEGCRYMFHLAALGSVPRSIVEPDRYQEVNTLGTLRVLQAAKTAGVQRVIYSGSSSAYGDAPGATEKSESMPPLPRSPYAATKLAGEQLMRAWACSYGLDTAVLRYFNVFGPRQSGSSAYAAVIAAFATAMRSGHTGTIYGDGRQTRDFTFVANAVYANLLAAAHPGELAGEVFNVGMGQAVNLLQLHDALSLTFGLDGRPPRFEPPRKGDVSWSKADIAKASSVLGYRPLVTFEDGLALTARWYQTQAGAGVERIASVAA